MFFQWSLCTAQQTKRDSLIRIAKDVLYMDSLRLYQRRKASFDFQLDNRNSFIRNQAIEITGFNPAVIINQKFRYGFGVYFVKFPYENFQSAKKTSVTTANTPTNRELSLFFATPNF